MMKVSVIVPVYNSEEFIESTLLSLSYQKMVDAEFICVDDGSTDNSLNICEHFSSIDCRFKVIHQENCGAAHARNVGLDVASGKYICFVDSDDILGDNALDVMFNIMEEQDADILVHSAEVMCEGPIPNWVEPLVTVVDQTIDSITIKDIFTKTGCRPFLWMHFIKRKIIDENNLRIDEDLVIGEDQAFEVSYFSKAKKVVFKSFSLYKYRIHPGSIMNKYESMPWEKVKQHIRLVNDILNTLSGKIQEAESVILIDWVLNLLYWDYIKLIYSDQMLFSQQILDILDSLHIRDVIKEMDYMSNMQYKHINSTVLYQNDLDKLIFELNALEEESKKKIFVVKNSLWYKIYEKIRSKGKYD